MAAKTECSGEVVGRAEIASREITSSSDQGCVLHVTVNLLNVIPTREVQVGIKGTGTASSHYWMNSLPFVKQMS
jgi:hypothetical protein